MDLWTEASRDVEAEGLALRMAQAKVSVAGLWPFLSLAQSEREFGHRLALAHDHIANAVPVDLLEPVVASLHEDFRAVASKDAEGEEQADDADDDGKPDWLQEKIKSKSSYFHAGLGRWVAGADDDGPTPQELAAAEPVSTEQFTTDAEDDAYWRSLGNSGPGDQHTYPHNASRTATAYWHAGKQAWVRTAGPQPPEDQPGGGNPYYFTGGPEGGPNTGQTNQYAPHPTGADPVDPINSMFPMQPSPWTVPPGGEWKEAPMQFNPPNPMRPTSSRHVAAPQPGETDRCSNCRLDLKAVPVSYGNGVDWTHTGEWGAHADDDHTPYPERYSRTATWHQAREGVEGGPGQNPDYFAGGHEGIAGDQQSGFPQDMAQQDPDDRVNELYGQTPISAGTYDDGSRVAFHRHADTPHHPAPDSDMLQGTDFDSPQERERWSKAVNGEQQGSRDSATFEGSRRGQFYDPVDPSVRMVAANPFSDGNPFGDASGEMGAPSGMGGMTPQTTSPRQMPGAGGGPSPFADQGDSDMAAQQQNQQPPVMGMRRQAEENSRDLASDDDPTGLGDEYRERTVEGPLRTRPRQPAEHRNVNTPQSPRGPIPTVSSPGPEAEEENDRREAALAADSVLRELVRA